MSRGKRCAKCLEWQPRNNFAPHRQHKDGLQSRCRKCAAANKRAMRRAKGMTPERDGTPSYCLDCHTRIHDGVEPITGLAVIWCSCHRGAMRYAPVIRPKTFKRYVATEERLRWLDERVRSARQPIEEVA